MRDLRERQPAAPATPPAGAAGLLLVLALAVSGCATPKLIHQGAVDADYYGRVAAMTTTERGLEFTEGVTPAVAETPAQVREAMRADFEKETTPAEWAEMRDGLAAFAMIPPDWNPHNELLDILQDNVAGYYDPETKRLVLVEMEIPTAMRIVSAMMGRDLVNEMTASHELVHALQDQRWGLKARMDAVEDLHDGDRSLAYQCLVEGDATVAGLRTVLAEDVDDDVFDEIQGGGVDEVDAPPAVAWLFVMPYGAGARFADHLRRSGGWDAVNAAHDDPPLSTEQILHPHKYMDAERDVPTPIAPPPVDDEAAWHAPDVMGEAGVLAWLIGLGADPDDAADAAAGWDGDRWRAARVTTAETAFDPPTAVPALVWDTIWDTAEDAAAFARAVVEHGAAHGFRIEAGADVRTTLGTSAGEDTVADPARTVRVRRDGTP